MLGLEILVLLCAGGGIAAVYPRTTWERGRKVRKRWDSMMKASSIKSSLDETFRVKKVEFYRDKSYDIKLRIPAGMTKDPLEPIQNELEYSLGGDVSIEWDKYSEQIVVHVGKQQKEDPVQQQNIVEYIENNLEQPADRLELLRSRWGYILSDSFKLQNLKESNTDNMEYLLQVLSPDGLLEDPIKKLRDMIKDNLKNETINNITRDHNKITVTIKSN